MWNDAVLPELMQVLAAAQAAPAISCLERSPSPPAGTAARVIVLEDSDLVHLKDGSYTLFNAAERKAEAAAAAGAAGQSSPRPKAVAVQRALQTLEMEVSQIMKGGFDHYMQASHYPALFVACGWRGGQPGHEGLM